MERKSSCRYVATVVSSAEMAVRSLTKPPQLGPDPRPGATWARAPGDRRALLVVVDPGTVGDPINESAASEEPQLPGLEADRQDRRGAVRRPLPPVEGVVAAVRLG